MMLTIAWLYLLAMGFICLYSLSQLQLLFYFIKYKLQKDKEERLDLKTYLIDQPYPLVTVQLPIYNEMYVVERLLEKVFGLDYPHDRLEIQILDDSTDETQTIIQDKLAILKNLYPNINYQYLHRTNRTGFKAGAMAAAEARGEFIAIFDADFAPEADFLLKTLPYFYQQEKLAAVQTRWTHINANQNLLTQLQAFMLDAHFSIEQFSRCNSGYFFNFNGTAGVWRAEAIADGGGWQADTITEDLDLSYRAQLKGWKLHYDDAITCPAEIPAAIQAAKSQQFRWTKGAAEVARKHLGALWGSKLSFGLKYQATAHLLNSSVFFAIIISSVLSVGFNYGVYTGEIGANCTTARTLMGGVFYVVLAFFSISFYYRHRLSFSSVGNFIIRFPLFLSATYGLSLHNSWAALQGYLGIKSEFVRTPKFNQVNFNQKNAYLSPKREFLFWGELLLLAYFAVGLGLDIVWGAYEMIPFHSLLCLGYGYVVGLQLFKK